MAKEEENKWTRPRGFWEINGGDILMVATALFFFAMTIGGFALFIFQPRIAGLHELFSDPPAAPPPDQKLHLAPGETEMRLFSPTGQPSRPIPPAPEPKK